ncbi:isopenicillin N synthase family oxygenase, partial [Amylibacter sp.]|nr:isopenicillin N synthase family oxygenase [Amylibacter sp.]
RAAAHEDINLITLLVTGTEPGLQAKDVNGNWHDVPCKPGYITVNSGDMLAMASKGHYPSTPHRVVNPPMQENRSRYSMPLFVHPRPDVLLDKMTAEEFLNERLKEIGLK